MNVFRISFIFHLFPFSFLFHSVLRFLLFFFFNDTATTEIYTLSLHDALPIYRFGRRGGEGAAYRRLHRRHDRPLCRSEEHTSELQSHLNLVCRLLLEKKKKHPRRTP